MWKKRGFSVLAASLDISAEAAIVPADDGAAAESVPQGPVSHNAVGGQKRAPTLVLTVQLPAPPRSTAPGGAAQRAGHSLAHPGT